MKIKFTYRPRIKNSVAQKTLSKLLAFGILINCMPITSFAGILSEDGRYETFTGNNITVNDILESDEVDVKIEGNTLVNAWDFKSINTIINHNTGSLINPVNDGWIKIKCTGNDWVTPASTNYSIIKPNTLYTIIFEVKNSTFLLNSNREESKVSINIDYKDHTTNLTESSFDSELTIPIKNGVSIHTLVSKSDLSNIVYGLRTQFQPYHTGEGECEFRVILLEGDWTNKVIPEYFEGVQSSFENNLITQEMIDNGEEKQENLGKYKVEVKTIGKNLFNINGNVNEYYDIMTVSNKNNIVENNTLIATALSRYYHGKGQIIKVKPYTDYTISFNLSDFSGCLELTTPTITNFKDFYIDVGYHEITFNSGNNQYLCIGFETSGLPSDSTRAKFSDIQLEEGRSATEYEPYKESIKTFYLNSPLLEGDTIEFRNGQLYHIRRYKQLVLDGSDDEGWSPFIHDESIINSRNNYLGYIYNIKGDRESVLICDKFTRKNSYLEDIKGIWTDVNLLIDIPKNELTSYDIEGFKEWLSLNPTKVVSKLENPIYEAIKTDLSVQLFKGTTHISNNSNIPAVMEITVDRTLNRAIEAIELAKINPTIDNLSKARMWTNLVKESLKKDELQDEINTITNIKGLELEKKSVTANVDIYIKSENSLSMTLSTNSIMFEDYSGVSDIEKLNALEITVNSSLPYDLNAYLESEIQNSDKSTTIDSNLLQIKESSNLDYKTFNNTTDKVILEEDCPSGNYNKHNIDLKMEGSNAYKADVYKTVIKFEAEQK